jgi:cyclopropane fatty-acyl-phospholipid synthase-like methyltransferase
MKELWDSRYKSEQFIYGVEPNVFLKEYLQKTSPGKILLPGDGEGRNAVYAAQQSWEVTAFDFSISGREKALNLAQDKGVNIKYLHCDVDSFEPNEKYDLISIIYFHLPEETRKSFHSKLSDYLNENGTVILECFAKSQIKNDSGGPKSLELLYSIEKIKNDFSDFKIELLEEIEIMLNEGHLHQGNANVIRLIARKI